MHTTIEQHILKATIKNHIGNRKSPLFGTLIICISAYSGPLNIKFLKIILPFNFYFNSLEQIKSFNTFFIIIYFPSKRKLMLEIIII